MISINSSDEFILRLIYIFKYVNIFVDFCCFSRYNLFNHRILIKYSSDEYFFLLLACMIDIIKAEDFYNAERRSI